MVKYKPSHKIKLDDPGEYFKNVSRGVGTVKPKKGKGSFKRSSKHKKGWY